MMNELINIALVDDHILLRKGLASLLIERGFPMALQADNGKEFITALTTVKTLPDVVLLDINMPVMDGYETAQWIRMNHPDMKMLALSVLDDENAIIRMLHAGARGYLLKDCQPEELTLAIRTIAEKGFYHSELLSSKLIHNMHSPAGQQKLTIDLTEKEIIFLKYICSELTYKEIAREMHLSPRTIDGYRDALFEKLDIKSRVGLVLFAIRHKLVIV